MNAGDTVVAGRRTARSAAVRWRGVALQARLQLRLLLRSPESLLVTLGLPAGILALFGSVEVLPTGEGDPTTFLVAGTVAVAVMATGLVAAAIQTAFERQYGVLKLLGATPLPRWGFVVAKAAAVAGLVLAQLGVLLVLAVVLLDWTPDVAWGGLVVATVVGTVAFTAVGQLLAGSLPAMVCLAVTNGAFVVLLAVSGLVFDADELPGAVAATGRVLPAGALGRALRGAMDPAIAPDPGAVVVVAAWGLVALLLTARLFRWEP